MKPSPAAVSGPDRIDQLLVRPILGVLIQTPARHLREDLVELLPRNRLIDEALAAREPAEVPVMVFELRRDRELPQAQVLRQVGLERALGAIERTEIAADVLPGRRLGNPPEGVERVLHDLAQAELLRHADLAPPPPPRPPLALQPRP